MPYMPGRGKARIRGDMAMTEDNKMPDYLYATPRGSGTMSGVYVDYPCGDEPRGEHPYIALSHPVLEGMAEALRDILECVARTTAGDVCQTSDFNPAREALAAFENMKKGNG